MVIYQICLGHLDALKLAKLQSSYFISAEQIEVAHEIAEDLLSASIQAIQSSRVYEVAKKKNSLFFNKNLLINNFSRKRFPELYDSEVLCRICVAKKPKRKLREEKLHNTTSKKFRTK